MSNGNSRPQDDVDSGAQPNEVEQRETPALPEPEPGYTSVEETPDSGGNHDNGRSQEDAGAGSEGDAGYAPTVEDPYNENQPDTYEPPDYYEAPYGDTSAETAEPPAPAPQAASAPSGAPPAAPPPTPPEEEDEEDEQMLRMSFLEHLEELRKRLFYCLAGVGVAFLLSLIFANDLWRVVSGPATAALKELGVDPPYLAQIKPMEVFTTVWVKLPMLTAIFLASPWVLYQVWAFIAPGLYRRERRWAAPFVLFSAGLFILGGVFAYFVAFRFGLVFLLGIGRDINIQPLVSVTEYFDLFVNVTLGVGIVFELPVLIFFLTLLRIVSPAFLMRNTRYALLAIVLLAAVVTPTPDVFNLMMFSVPMILLYFVGVFASYLLVLNRENRKFPWSVVLLILLGVALVVAGAVYVAITQFGYHFVPHWPILTR